MRAASNNEVAVAYAAVVGENLGFYGVMTFRELAATRRSRTVKGQSFSWRDGLRIAFGLVIEFGPAEILDSTLIRPAAMGIGVHVLGDGWGIIAGKLAADVLFYIPAILVFEWRQRRQSGE
jgi:hypothetical protein